MHLHLSLGRVPSVGCLVYTPSARLGLPPYYYFSFGTMHPTPFVLGLCTLNQLFGLHTVSLSRLTTHYFLFGTMHPTPIIWAYVPSFPLSVYAPSVLPYRYYYPPFSWVYAPVIFMWVYAPIIFVLVAHLLLLSGFMHPLPSFLGFLYTRHLSSGFVYPQFAVWFTNHYFIPDFIHLYLG
jgi:hypothetical protein